MASSLVGLAGEYQRRILARMLQGTALGNAMRRLDEAKRRTVSAVNSVAAKVRQKMVSYRQGRQETAVASAPDPRRPKNSILQTLFKALGPVGDIFKALLFPVKQAAIGAARQLKAAANLLRAFGGAKNVMPQAYDEKKQTEELIGQVLKQAGWEPSPGGQGLGARERIGEQEVEVRTGGGKPPSHGSGGATVAPAGGFNGRARVGNKWVSDQDPVVTGEMIHVSSSNVYAIGFDIDPTRAAIGTLKVTFRADAPQGSHTKPDSPGSTYFYKQVRTQVFEAFQKAASKGKFVWDKLRIRGTVSGHQYDYELAGVSQDYVPRKATVRGEHEWYIPRTFVQEGRILRSPLGAERVRAVNGRPNRGNTGQAKNGSPRNGGPRSPNNGAP